ncbi:MAG: acyl carrier protein [Chloroflexaceae bacterium]|nr:acyl carrier protein [Chloroflexaceae bacterium]
MQTQSYSSKLSEEMAVSPAEAVQNWLIAKLSEQLSLDASTVNATEPLTRYGLDSIDAVTMVGDLEDWLDLELPSTLFWDYPTLEKASLYLAENYDLSAAVAQAKPKEQAPVDEPAANGKGGGFFSRFRGA